MVVGSGGGDGVEAEDVLLRSSSGSRLGSGSGLGSRLGGSGGGLSRLEEGGALGGAEEAGAGRTGEEVGSLVLGEEGGAGGGGGSRGRKGDAVDGGAEESLGGRLVGGSGTGGRKVGDVGGDGLGLLGGLVGVDLEGGLLLGVLLLHLSGRLVLLGAVGDGHVDVVLGEGEGLVNVVDVVLELLGRKGDGDEDLVVHQVLEEEGTGLEVDVLGTEVLLEEGNTLGSVLAELGSELGDGGEAVALDLGVGLLVEEGAEGGDDGGKAAGGGGAVLTEDVGDDADEDVGKLGLVEELEVHGDGLGAELGVGGGIALALIEELHDGVGDGLGDLVAGGEEEGGDGADVPVGVAVVEALGEVVDTLDEDLLEVLIGGVLEEVEHLVDDDLDVVDVADAEEEVEGLSLEGLVVGLEAVHDSHLVGGGGLGVLLDDLLEGGETDVLEVGLRGLDELGDVGVGGLHQGVVGVDAEDGADALEGDGEAGGQSGLGALEGLGDDVVHLLGGGEVAVAEAAEEADELDLEPGGGHSVVVVVAGELALDDLLLDADDGVDEVLGDGGVVAGEVVDEDDGGGHDGGVAIADHLGDLGVVLGDGVVVELVEAVEGEDGLLSDELTLVGEEVDDGVDDGGDELDSDELGDGDQGVGDLDVIGAGHVLLEHVDDHHTELVLGTDAGGGDEVADLLEVDVVVGGKLDALDVAKGAIVAEHLSVEHSEHVLVDGFLGHGEGGEEHTLSHLGSRMVFLSWAISLNMILSSS